MLLNVQADPHGDGRGRMLDTGIIIIDRHGKENVPLLFPIFENYLNKKVGPLILQYTMFLKLLVRACSHFCLDMVKRDEKSIFLDELVSINQL